MKEDFENVKSVRLHYRYADVQQVTTVEADEPGLICY